MLHNYVLYVCAMLSVCCVYDYTALCVPGTVPCLGAAESQLPILLLQQTDGPRGGWDIILPAGWGMAFWVAFVYSGATIGGQQQLRQVAAESRQLHFVPDFPDTPACRQWDELVRAEAINRYERRPPAKRVNYAKLGTAAHAFRAPWSALLRQWGSNEEEFYVLRSRHMLKALERAVKNCKADALHSFTQPSCAPTSTSILTTPACLVAVCLEGVRRGLPTQLASICLPSNDDLAALTAGNHTGPTERIHKVTKKPKLAATVDVAPVHCLRITMGYVSRGNFSLSEGRGVGVGFVALRALLAALEQQKGRKMLYVLVRGVADTSYRFYKLHILMPH